MDGAVSGDAHPAGYAHLIIVINQSGRVIAEEVSGNLISGHVNHNGKFYYSCRSYTAGTLGGIPPADEVKVYDLKDAILGGISDPPPLLTSTDPVFLHSACD